MKELLAQKIIGVVVILLGLLTCALLRDLTFTLFVTTPLGIWMLVSKKSVIAFDDDDE